MTSHLNMFELVLVCITRTNIPTTSWFDDSWVNVERGRSTRGWGQTTTTDIQSLPVVTLRWAKMDNIATAQTWMVVYKHLSCKCDLFRFERSSFALHPILILQTHQYSLHAGLWPGLGLSQNKTKSERGLWFPRWTNCLDISIFVPSYFRSLYWVKDLRTVTYRW